MLPEGASFSRLPVLFLMKFASTLLISCSILLPQAVAQVTLNPIPTRAIGQTSLQVTNFNPNLVEGRELLNPEGVALDTSTNPPGLYIVDTGNNRVLGFRSSVGFSNGQKADLVLGQPDFVTTLAQGPGHSSRSTGFTSPTGIAVDAKGNVYVVDSGNNRILRFPKPFAQSGDQIPDLVIGQAAFSTAGANQGGVSAGTLAFSSGNTTLISYLTFDSGGNLWATDPGNNRVLRYNASLLGDQAVPGPIADLVLGQQDFTTSSYNPGSSSLTTLSALATPTGITFDAGGRLFIAESVNSQRSRILVWTPPFRTGQLATRIVGVDTDTPAPPFVSERQLNAGTGALFAVGNQVGIADSNNNRLVLYPAYEQWSGNTLNQSAVQVVGQADFFSGAANQGQSAASGVTLFHPASAAFSGSELFVVDSLNHRTVVLPQANGGFGAATRVLGQDGLTLNSPNLIEGRELNFSMGGDAGVAVDLTANPPRLFIADTYNNRILGYKDLRNFQTGAKADIVIGQPDFQHSRVNYPSNNVNQLNQSGLLGPTGLYVDPDGNLYVADTGNGRVLRFPKPFDNYRPGTMEAADLVLGQANFFTKITDATSRTMAAPYGIAQASEHGLLVSDLVHSRVLYFPGTSKTFTNGETATIVFGQKDFSSSGTGGDLNQMNAPRHIATDADDHLYVADTLNGRVLIFDHAPTAISGTPAAITLTNNLSRPRGLYVSPLTNEIWVADAGTNAAIRFPPFNSLPGVNFAANATLSASTPLALAQDAWGDIFIADNTNRVVVHYPGLSALNAANFLRPNSLAPGMISALYSTGNLHQFGAASQTSSSLPLPRTLNGVQVLFNGAPVPLFYAGMDQINFQVPSGAPTSGTADLQVLEVATGRSLGATTVGMTSVNPGLFTQAANGIGAALAANKDGTLNTATNPAIAGDIITLYGTGEGVIPGGPADGDVIHTALPSPRPPTVIVGVHAQTGSDVPYAGVAPEQVGVWQVNVRIPADTITLPTAPTQVIVLQDSQPSGGAPLGRAVIIYVKQPA
jgi:uncharacterized protein (TIGR03437 family)